MVHLVSQDLSIAGKRAGLAGERSGLFMEATRIIKEMRHKTNGEYPRFAIWENVVGAFSSNGGSDFKAVLEELARCVEQGISIPEPNKEKWAKAGFIYGDGWSIAWRTFDAQYWGVPQRRRRIAAVLDLRGQSAGEILAQQEGLPGNSDEGIKPWKGIARDPKASSIADDQPPRRNWAGFNCIAIQGNMIGRQDKNDPAGCGYNQDTAYTLNTIDQQGIAYGIGAYASNAWKSPNPNSGVYEADVAKTLDAINCGYPGCNQGGTAICEPVPCTLQIRGGCEGGGKCALIQSDKTGALTCVQDKTLFQPIGYDARGNGNGIVSPTITCDHNNRVTDYTTIITEQSYGLDRAFFNQGRNAQFDFSVLEELQPTLTAKGPGAVCNGIHPCTVGNGQVESLNLVHDKASTLNCMHDQQIVLDTDYAVDVRNGSIDTEINGTLQAGSFKNLNSNNTVMQPNLGDIRYIVRRLTPLECERLQGFPDGWTDIGDWTDSKGKLHKPSDSPRYKALGNSIALPQWWWIVCKMSKYLNHGATLASLFDGIGGFPLVWETYHGIGTALWASEIEEFPIAVTKYRFPEVEDWMC